MNPKVSRQAVDRVRVWIADDLASDLPSIRRRGMHMADVVYMLGLITEAEWFAVRKQA